jgi:hypothetical protein
MWRAITSAFVSSGASETRSTRALGGARGNSGLELPDDGRAGEDPSTGEAAMGYTGRIAI